MSDKPYVAKESDLSILSTTWAEVKQGNAKSVLLSAPFGGGKRAIVNELGRQARQDDGDTLFFRVFFSDEDNGQSAMIKLYAGLFQFLHGNLALRGKVEMALSSQIPSQTERVQTWYRSFIEGMKQGAPKPGEDRFQVHLPKDNPLLAFVEIIHGIAQAFPTILAIQNTQALHSLPMAATLKALLDEIRNIPEAKLLTIIDILPIEENNALISEPLKDVLNSYSDHFVSLRLQPWDASDVKQYITSKGQETFGLEEKIAELTSGRPGFIDELYDILKDDEDLRARLPSLSLAQLADVTPDEDELEDSSEESSDDGNTQKKRPSATASDAETIAYVGAMLGQAFPGGVVADFLEFNRDSVDNIIDATENIYTEVQNSEALRCWIYRFNRAIYKESILARRQSDEDKQLANKLGQFIERFLSPAGYGYVIKALQVYQMAGNESRATIVRNIAMGADQPQMWLWTKDIFDYYDEISWSDPMKRMTFLNLAERLSVGGEVKAAEAFLEEARAWAETQEDSAMVAFLSLNGSKLDARRGDLYRARTRANEALKQYETLDNKIQQAESLSQLANIEFNDGKFDQSLEYLNRADEITELPPIKARTRFLRGLLAQRSKEFQASVNYFAEARQLAQQSGRGILLLDSSMKIGEILFMSKQFSKAADELSRVAQLANQLKAPVQERAACALLAQAHGAQKNFEAALQFATRTLQLSQQLKFEQVMAADFYSVGLFNLLQNKPSEAVAFFKQASSRVASGGNPGFLKELYFNMGQALLQIGEKGAAEQSLQNAIKPAVEAKDVQKSRIAYQQLGDLAHARNEISKSSEMYNNALRIAKESNDKEAQKDIKRRMKDLKIG